MSINSKPLLMGWYVNNRKIKFMLRGCTKGSQVVTCIKCYK